MPRACTICAHKKVKEIDKLIAEGKPFRRIAFNYGLIDASISRHTQNCLKLELSVLIAENKKARAIDFEQTISNLYFKAERMLDAVEKWLTDPEDEDQFDISPRDDEMVVIYLDNDDLNGQLEPKQKKAQLRQLLELIEIERLKTWEVLQFLQERGDLIPKDEILEFVAARSKQRSTVITVNSTAVDNRKLYLETFKTLTDRLEQYGKFHGLFTKDRENPQVLQGVIAAAKQLASTTGRPFEEELQWIIDNREASKVPDEVVQELKGKFLQ
jgi:hypothetical protein